MRAMFITTLTASLGLVACGVNEKPELIAAADRVFVNAAVYMVDEQRSWAEAVAIKNGEIIYVGDDDGAASYIGTETMIAAYTINGAYQMKLDDVQGSIEVGKRADFVVLDRNLFEVSASEINDAKVMMTIFDGRTVYE